MMDPRRLLEEGGTELERTLLRAGKDERPEPGAKHRAAIAIGLAGGAAAGTATGTAVAAGVGKAASAGGAFVLVKWIGIGVATTALAVTTVTAVRSSGEARAPVAHVVASAPPPDAFGRIPPPPSLAEVERANAAEIARPVASAPVAAPIALAPHAAPSVTSAPPSIAGEVALLDRARAAVAANDAPLALRLLDEHERTYASGALGPEANVIRIDALVAAGDRAAARAEADRFLAAHPDGPLSHHVNAVADRLRTNP